MDNLNGKLKMENNKHHTYEDGLREGRFRAIESKQEDHSNQLDSHSKRLSAQERITYSLLGAIALLEILPTVRLMLIGG